MGICKISAVPVYSVWENPQKIYHQWKEYQSNILANILNISKQRNCFRETSLHKNSFNFQTLHIFAKKHEIFCAKSLATSFVTTPVTRARLTWSLGRKLKQSPTISMSQTVSGTGRPSVNTEQIKIQIFKLQLHQDKTTVKS